MSEQDISIFHVCRFSSLDDLPKKMRGNPQAVAEAALRAGRFSVFEMEGKLAGIMTALFHSLAWLERDPTKPDRYPWTYVRLTDKGRIALRGAMKP